MTVFDNRAFEDDNGKSKDVETTAEPTYEGKITFTSDEKLRIYKNLGVLSIGFMLLYAPFIGTVNLQSTLNAEDGLGTLSLGLIYITLTLSSLFLPTFVIKMLTTKWAIFVGVCTMLPYIFVQSFPSFYTLFPASILVGIGAAPMWAALQTYLTQLAQVHAILSGQVMDVVITRFFGLFFFFWQTCDLWGNLLSSVLLTNPNPPDVEPNWETCGSDFCLSDNNDDVERPPDMEIYVLTSVYLSLVVAVLLMIGLMLDPLKRYGEKRDEGSAKDFIFATLTQMKKPKQQLLICASMFIGMEQAFMSADYSAAFVSCALSVNWIGYVLLTYGMCAAVFSPIFGSAMQYTGRIPIVILGIGCQTTIFIYSLFWDPDPSDKIVFFVVAGLFGMGDAALQTQINGFYGSLFRRNKEAAFSNYRLWESLGFSLSFFTSTYFCIKIKLIFLACFAVISLAGYLVCELWNSKTQRRITIMSLGSLKDQQIAQLEIKHDDAHDDLEEKIDVVH